MPRHSQPPSFDPDASGERYQQVFETASAGLFVLDVVGPDRFIIANVNPAFETLTGLRMADCRGCLIGSIEHGRLPFPSLQDCRQCVATAAPFEGQCEFSVAGESRRLAARLTPRCDATGRVTRLIGELRDTGNAEQMGRRFYEQAEQFRALVENSPDFISRHSIDGRCLYFNPALERAAGVKLEQVRGKAFFEIASPDESAARFHATVMAVVRQRVPIEAEFRSDVFYGGQTMWQQVQFVPEFDRDGQLLSVLAVGRDITEKKRAEELAHEHAEKFRALADNAPDFICRYDTEGRIVYVNPAVERSSGVTFEQLRGKLPTEVGAVDDGIRQLERSIKEIIRTGEPLEKEIYLGQSIPSGAAWHQIRLVPEFDREGRIASVLVIGRDISRTKRAEEQLRRREQEFRTLAENSPDFISRFDKAGRFLYANPTVERATGMLLAQLQEMQQASTEGYQIRQRVAEVIRTCAPLEVEACLEPITANGVHVWHQIRFEPEFDHGGQLTSVLCIGRDITQLKQAEEQLRLREQEFRSLAENSPDIIMRFDRELRCLYVNRAITKISGLPTERFLGTRPGELGPVHGGPQDDADIAKLKETCSRAFASGLIQKEEIGFRDSKVFEFQIVPERNSEGTITSLLSVSRDITEVRRSEAAVKQLNAVLEERVAARTAELEEANRELERFAYTVSHDLRAPLRVINGFAHHLLEGEHMRLSAEGRRMLEHIGNAGTKLGRLIEDILEYSRVGHARLQRRPVDLAALAHEVVESMRPDYPHSQVVIDNLPEAYGDPTMLRQVLQNLLNNAFKFSSRRSEPHITVGAREERGEVAYFVADNGVGFDMRYADKLFGVFQRFHAERDYPGTGAGLAIVKRLVERHGGRIWVESTPDMVTTFHFTLQ